MSELQTEGRIAGLKVLGDHTHGAMTWSELFALEAFLRDKFGIVQPPGPVDWHATLVQACGPDVAKEFRKVNQQRARLEANGQPFPYSLENRFYDLIARQPLFGLVHSQKHPIIFDAAAFLVRVARAAQIKGSALDLGCNGGYHAAWLARTTPVSSVKGVDRSLRTIEFARELADELSLGARVAFDRSAFPEAASEGSFGLVYSIDGAINWDEPNHWAAAERLLSSDGVLVWIGDAGKRMWPPTTLGCLVADVVGGWNGAAFDSKPALIFAKGERNSVASDPIHESFRFWDTKFKPFANSGVAARWKTQAFCRAWLAHGAPPPESAHVS